MKEILKDDACFEIAQRNKCPVCENGHYTHGSALYKYYSCGHAYEKPLYGDPPEGRMVRYKSPYPPYCNQYGGECSKEEMPKHLKG